MCTPYNLYYSFVEEWARLALCRTLTRLSNNDVLVYISLPLCNFTTSEEEEIINFINSILLPHQVAVVTTRNSRSDLSTKSSNHFEMSNQHLEKVHEYQLSASEITVDDQNINIGIQFQDEDYLKDWQ